MKKRIKLKKGLLHKKCDSKCRRHRLIKEFKFVTNNACMGCRFKEEAYEKLCKVNQY